jgi:hypothetical protein
MYVTPLEPGCKSLGEKNGVRGVVAGFGGQP